MWSIPPTPFVPTCYYPPPVIACPPQPCKPIAPCCPPSHPCHPCCGGCCGPKQMVYIPIPQPKKKRKSVGAKKPSRPCPPPTLNDNDNQSEYNNCNFFMNQLPQELLKRFACCEEEESEESEDCTEDTDWDETCTGDDTAGTTCEEETCPCPPPPPPQCNMNPCFPGFPSPYFPCFPNPLEMMCGMGGGCGGCGGQGMGNSNGDECESDSGDPYGRGEGPYEDQSYRDPSGRGGPYNSQSYRDPYSRGPENYNSHPYGLDRSTSNRVGRSSTQGTQWSNAASSSAQTRTTNISVTTGMSPTHSQIHTNTLISTTTGMTPSPSHNNTNNMISDTTGMTPTHSQVHRSNTRINVTTGMTPYQSRSETALDSQNHSYKHQSQQMEHDACCGSDSGEIVPVRRKTTKTEITVIERENEPAEIFVEQKEGEVLSYGRNSKDTGTLTSADRSCGSGSHKKKHKKKKKKYCYDPCAMPCCPEPHTRRLHRLCSDMAMKRERRLSQIHQPEPECCFEPPPCPIRETKASILRKRPPAKCKHRKQEAPPFHEYCMTNNAFPETNRYPLLTYDMPPSYGNEGYNETQDTCGGTHHEGHHSHQHHQHGCNKVQTRGAKRRRHHC